MFLNYWFRGGPKHFLREKKLVRYYFALHDDLSKSIGAVDEDDIRKTSFGIYCEHYSRCSKICAHHSLYCDRQCNLSFRIPFFCPVIYRSVIVKRCKCCNNGLFYILSSSYS